MKNKNYEVPPHILLLRHNLCPPSTKTVVQTMEVDK
jgi:hypothetical protein